MPDNISFSYEEVDFRMENTNNLSQWIKSVIEIEGYRLKQITYIFCSDDYLLGVNKEYLDHDFFTDIITFDQSDDRKLIEADIFISVDRVRENAATNNEQFDHELRRVMIHGVLHLMGYNDKTSEQERQMRKKEDTCLSLHDQ